MCSFFLFDGLNWIVVGALTAAGDTKFIFWVSTCTHWLVYALPAYIAIRLYHQGPDTAWMIIALSSLFALTVYLFRYCSGKWLKNFLTQRQSNALVFSTKNNTILDSSTNIVP